MQSTISEMERIIDQYLPGLRAIPENEFVVKVSPVKWSKKEMLGHLIDSAQNNIRRFLVAQYEDNPVIVYNQDKWVAINGYRQSPIADLIDLWYLLNRQISSILKNMPDKMKQRQCKTQELHSIEWLAGDYTKHLLHHLHVILDLEPVAYP